MGLLITFILGAFVLIGALIAGVAKNGDRIRELSIAVALGAMAMLLIDDLVPEMVEGVESIGIWPTIIGVAVGVVVLIVLDRFLPEAHHEHGHVGHQGSALHISVATTIALVIHNVIEGMSVYSMSLESATTAILLGLGIGVHNVPLGMIVYAGVRDGSRKSKIVMLALAALSTFVGGLLMWVMRSAVDERVIAFMICLTVGLLLYIIVFELIPHVVRAQNKRLAIGGVILGLAVVYAGGMLEMLA